MQRNLGIVVKLNPWNFCVKMKNRAVIKSVDVSNYSEIDLKQPHGYLKNYNICCI